MAIPAYTLDIDTPQPYQVHVGTFLLEQVGQITRSVVAVSYTHLALAKGVLGVHGVHTLPSLRSSRRRLI